MTAIKELTKVLPAPTGSHCCFQVGMRPSGHPTYCPTRAVIKLDDHCYCSHHAEFVMMQCCARNVRIQRGGTVDSGGVVVDSRKRNKRATTR